MLVFCLLLPFVAVIGFDTDFLFLLLKLLSVAGKLFGIICLLLTKCLFTKSGCSSLATLKWVRRRLFER